MHRGRHRAGSPVVRASSRQVSQRRSQEMKILADLKGEGVVEHAYRRSHGPGVFLIVNASNLEDAQRQLGRLPFVALGLLTFDLTPINEI
jgi:hypothetical protein